MPSSTMGRERVRGKRFLSIAVAAVTTSSILFIGGQPAQAAFTGSNGWVAFSGLTGNGSVQVWRTGGAGRPLMNLTGTSGTSPIMHNDNFAPAWSPEAGAHIAFVSAARYKSGHGPGDIWSMQPYPRMKPSQMGLRNLTKSPGVDDESPAWDNTGGHVLYSRAPVVGGHDGAADIWRVSWQGNNPVNLTPGTASDDLEPA